MLTATVTFGLLLVVGRIFFDHDQGVLLHGVVGAVIEHDFGHALGSGLHHVAFFQRDVVVRVNPGAAARLLDLDRAVKRGEAGLLFGPGGRFVGRGRHPGDPLQHAGRHIAGRLDRVVGELREGEVHRHPEDERHREHDQQHAAIGNRRPGNVDTRLALRRHGGH